MSFHRGHVLAGALTLLAVLILTSPASACSCTGLLTPTQNLATADAVFVGTVTEVVRIGEVEEDFVVTLSVQRSWKGIAVTEVEVRTPAFTSLCGYDGFAKGDDFLVYALSTVDGKLSTNICTRTRTIAQAQDDLVELGPSTIVGTEHSTFGTMKGHFDR